MKINLTPTNAFRLFIVICLLLSAVALPSSRMITAQAHALHDNETLVAPEETTPTPEEIVEPTPTPGADQTQEPQPTPTPEAPPDPTPTPEPLETLEPEPTATALPPSELPTQEEASGQAAGLCATVTEIPQAECEALLALFQSAGGSGWINNTGWNSTATPCSWYGVTCELVGPQYTVTAIRLGKNNLTGVIPTQIQNLTNLQTLDLDDNLLSGPIPVEIGALTNLQILILNENSLSGPIPAQIGSLTKLQKLHLYSNELTGEIPQELSNLTELTDINLGINLLTGQFPAWIGDLTKLTSLNFENNSLTGEIPTSIQNLKNLSRFWFPNNNIHGSIPLEIGLMPALGDLNGEGNALTGAIPEEINQTQLRLINLADNQLTSLPANFGILNIQHLNLRNNQISGPIPVAFENMDGMETLELANNRFTGPIPNFTMLAKLEILALNNNQLSGAIPATLGNLLNLTYVNLSNNALTGEIPPSLGNLLELTELRLSHNQLSGLIPAELQTLTKLTRLYLDHNQLSGTWPIWLEKLVALEELNIANNDRMGNVLPPAIGNLANLRLLDISHNHFWGEIPLAITKLTKLNTGAGAYTDIGHNHLSSKNTTVRSFLSRIDPDWERTQTPTHPIPVIQSLRPPSVILNSTNVTLQVRGRPFMDGAVVFLDGIPYPTTFINTWTLAVTIPDQFMTEEKTIKVTVKNPWPTFDQSAPFDFHVSDLMPAIGTTVLSRMPDFLWYPVPGADEYQLQLSTAKNFSTILMRLTSPDNYLTLTRSLPLNRIIYWRVRGRVAGVYQAWSDTYHFRSANPPSTPVLSSPADNSLTTNYLPRLVWGISSLPTGTVFESYELQIASDAAFLQGSIVLNEHITSRGRPVYTVGAGVLAPNTKYYWRVRAFNTLAHFSNWSAVRTIRAAMLPPVLLEPVLGSTALTPRPAMSWQPVDGAASYQIQFSLTSTFSELLHSGSPPGAAFTPTINLPQNRTIHWRVRARGPNGPSLWTRSSFRSANPPSTPALTSPANNALLTSYSPTLTWRTSTVPTGTTFERYDLEVALDNAFNTIIYDEEISGNRLTTSFTLPVTEPNTRYFWRVRSWNTAGHYSTWSAVRNFRSAMLPVSALFEPEGATPRPRFSWTPVVPAAGPQPVSYTIQFSLNAGFSSLITSGTAAMAEFTPTIDLPRNRTIYWRVRANGEFGPTLWTPPSSFLSANPPSTPSLLSPANNSLTTDYLPLLNWSASSVPAGTTFKHYRLEVAVDNTFTNVVIWHELPVNSYQFAPGELQPNTRYFWRVRAHNQSDQYSTWSAARAFRAAMLPPELVPGVSDAHTRRPVFTWAAVNGASHYTIQLSLLPNFSSILASASPASATWSANVTLPQNRDIYWRVRAFGANGPSLWSEFSSFRSANPPTTPTLLSPANGIVLKTAPSRLDWSSSVVPFGTTFARYEVEIAANSSFSGSTIIPAGAGNITHSHLDWVDIAPALLAKTRYHWRVRSVNEAGEVSMWSTRWSFTTP